MYVKTTETNRDRKPEYRQVVSLSYWKNNQLHILPITKESVTEFLSACGSDNIIVTTKNKMYYTPDTPGFADGEVTTTINSVIDGLETIVEGEKISRANMAEVISTNGLAFYADPGHGWLRVPLSLIRYLKINELISGYSYKDSKWAYLEEDCDMTKFFIAIGLPFNKETKELFRAFWQLLPQHNTNSQSFIRNLPGYDHQAMAARFRQSSLGSIDTIVHKLALG